MSDVRLLFPTEYLAAPDLRGKDVDLTISSVTAEMLKSANGEEKKGVIYFRELHQHAEKTGEKEKRLVLNKTNMKTIAAMHGYEGNEWAGKRITLFPTTCSAFGETVDCIRVRPTEPKQEKTK